MGEGVSEQEEQGVPGDARRTVPARSDSQSSRRAWALRGLAFAAIAFGIYWPALWGEFISDDWAYIVDNPFLTPFGGQMVAALFDPGGAASLYVVNYAPVHLFAHALELAAFGPAVLGYHVVNVLAHLVVVGLLVALLRRTGVPDAPALLAGLFFLVHPANVEAVAWISQLKTTGSTAFALAALLALRRDPATSALLFALALLTKASALFALPMAAAFVWSWRSGARHWLWIGVWAAIFALYAVPEFAAFEFGGKHVEAAYENPWVQLRSVAAIGARYLVMAATSFGVSALQEPRPVEAVLDPWWLLSLPLASWLAWRILSSLARRRVEAAWWLAAAAAFAPVSQIFPFIHPVADRYLYPMLPGLLGGSLLAAAAWHRRFTLSPAAASRVALGALGFGVLVCVLFGVRSHARAALWQAPDLTMRESAANYPDGVMAHTLRACEAAERGDAEAVVAALRRAVELSPASLRAYYAEQCLADLLTDPIFLSFVREQAAQRIAVGQQHGYSTQHWLRSRANDYLLLGDLEGALAAFEAALRAGGPRSAEALEEIEAVRTMLLAQRRGEPIPQLFSLPVQGL